MIDIGIALWDKLHKQGVAIPSTICIMLLLLAGYLLVREYGKGYWAKLLHKRNLPWFIGWIISLTAMIWFVYSGILQRCPTFLQVLIAVLFVLFSAAVFCSISGTVFLTHWYLQRYEKWLSEGMAYEHRSFVEKKPWFLMDQNEIIAYEVLRSSYLHRLGDPKGAYDAICSVEEMPLYPQERISLDTNRVYILTEMGDLPKGQTVADSLKEMDYPAYCFLSSYILELQGNVEEAFTLAVAGENSMEPGYRNLRVKVGLYNHLGRLYYFRGNHSEIFRYYEMAKTGVRKLKDVSQYHIIYSNIISQELQHGYSAEKIDELVREYTALINPHSVSGISSLTDLRLLIARHRGNEEAEYRVIIQGYESLKKVTEKELRMLHEVNTLKMLDERGFVLSQILPDIEAHFEEYFLLPMPYRIQVLNMLAYNIGLSDYPIADVHQWKERIDTYFKEYAISELDEFLHQIPSACVNQRCWVLLNKVDISVRIGGNKQQQLKWLNEVLQICRDHNLLWKEAQTLMQTAKNYAQQSEMGNLPLETADQQMRPMLEQALHLTERLPWTSLPELLLDIACGYGFLHDWDRVKHILNRFDNLGFKETHCTIYQQMDLARLRKEVAVSTNA